MGVGSCQRNNGHARAGPLHWKGELVTEHGKGIAAVIADIIQRSPVAVRRIAREAGVDYTTLYKWASGDRNPSRENLLAVADALDKHGGTLAELAAELRTEAEGGNDA